MAIKAVVEFNDGRLSIHSSDIKSISKTFRAGIYVAEIGPSGKLHINTKYFYEVHKPFPNENIDKIIKYCNKFIKKKFRKKINKLGYLHKLGILIHGDPGVGKTAFFNYLSTIMRDKHDAIIFFCKNINQLTTTISLCDSIRGVQDNPIIVIADEFERWAHDNESELKNFLDGVDSVDNTIFLAATNYIHKIPDSLKDRPSRFKIVLKMEAISDVNIIESIVRNKCDNILEEDSIRNIVGKLSEKCVTLDSIKESIIDSVIDSELDLKFTNNKIAFKL